MKKLYKIFSVEEKKEVLETCDFFSPEEVLVKSINVSQDGLPFIVLDNRERSPHFLPKSRFILSWSSEIKDSAGVEIFDGDILKVNLDFCKKLRINANRSSSFFEHLISVSDEETGYNFIRNALALFARAVEDSSNFTIHPMGNQRTLVEALPEELRFNYIHEIEILKRESLNMILTQNRGGFPFMPPNMWPSGQFLEKQNSFPLNEAAVKNLMVCGSIYEKEE